MLRPLADLSGQELVNLIANYKRHNRTAEPRYIEALAEHGKRNGRGLTFEVSLNLIRKAAKERRFLSYKELADGSGAEWSKVHYAIGAHLWDLVEYAHRHGWPMVSAIVVNKQHVDSGMMEPETLSGFVAAARNLKIEVTDPEAFLREQQMRVFDWAQSG